MLPFFEWILLTFWQGDFLQLDDVVLASHLMTLGYQFFLMLQPILPRDPQYLLLVQFNLHCFLVLETKSHFCYLQHFLPLLQNMIFLPLLPW